MKVDPSTGHQRHPGLVFDLTSKIRLDTEFGKIQCLALDNPAERRKRHNLPLDTQEL